MYPYYVPMIKIWRWFRHLVQELYSTFLFLVLAPGGQAKNQTGPKLACVLLLPSSTYVQSFRAIAPAVTKRAMLTDDDHF
jgi:hypothetical protein